jgi:hypothetical protein
MNFPYQGTVKVTSEFSNFSILVLSTVFAQVKEAVGDYLVTC